MANNLTNLEELTTLVVGLLENNPNLVKVGVNGRGNRFSLLYRGNNESEVKGTLFVFKNDGTQILRHIASKVPKNYVTLNIEFGNDNTRYLPIIPNPDYF